MFNLSVLSFNNPGKFWFSDIFFSVLKRSKFHWNSKVFYLTCFLKTYCLSGEKLKNAFATEKDKASDSHLSKDLTALLMSCNRSTSPRSNRSKSLFNRSCGGRDPSPRSSVCGTIEVGPEGLATGIGCFLIAFAPTLAGIEFDRFFGEARFESLSPAF